MVKYALNINNSDVKEFLRLEGICKDELIIRYFLIRSMKDFNDLHVSDQIKHLRFNYFKEKQSKILEDFQQFLITKTQKIEELSSEPETLEEEPKQIPCNSIQVPQNPQNLKADPFELNLRFFDAKSQSTPKIRPVCYSSTNFSPSLSSFTSRVKQKPSFDFEKRLKKHRENLEIIEREKEEQLQNKLKRLEKNSHKSLKTDHYKKYLEKIEKIKEKGKEIQNDHEEFIKKSIQKHLEIETRIKEKMHQKIKDSSAKAKTSRKDLIDTKIKQEIQKEVERHQSYFKKVQKIEEIRKKNKEKFNFNMKKPETTKHKMKNESSQDFQIKSDRQEIQVSPRSDLKKEENKKKITKKELNRLIVDTRISRNKFRMVINIQTLEREKLFQNHINKISKINEFQKSQKSIFRRFSSTET